MSPYLTSKTAERLIGIVLPMQCQIYTLFSAELFIDGSSSIKTLRKLINDGFMVYHLPKLHAKVLYSKDLFCTIGSQNLTKNGMNNKELSIYLSDQPTVLKNIGNTISEWVKDAQLITIDMVDDLEENSKKLKKQHKKLLDQIIDLENEIWAAETQRKKTIEDSVVKTRAQIAALQKSVTEINKSKNKATCRVQPVSSGIFSEINSLIVQEKEDLTTWWFDSGLIKLEKKYRYLCLMQANGKLGWARVFPTRISFIEPTVRFSNYHYIGSYLCRIELQCIWDDELLKHNNIVAIIQQVGMIETLKINIWITPSEVKINSYDYGNSETVLPLHTWCVNNQDLFKEKMLDLILSPFLYESKLSGVSADTFFNGVWSWYYLNAGLINGKPFLIAR